MTPFDVNEKLQEIERHYLAASDSEKRRVALKMHKLLRRGSHAEGQRIVYRHDPSEDVDLFDNVPV